MIFGFVILLAVTVSAFLFWASYRIDSGIYLKALCRIDTEKPQVVLTFDDGPDPVQTPKVLDVLKSAQTPAIFFLVGNRASLYPDLVRRIVSEGHKIGIHSYQHQGTFPLSRATAIHEDLQQCMAVLEQITGERPTLFRPPFGVTNPPIARAVKSLGLRTIGWSVRSYDTCAATPRADVVSRIMRQVSPGDVILLHDNRADSEILLCELIRQLQFASYTITSQLN